MSVLWLKNLLGYHLSEEELRDISSPRSELLLHVTHRCTQATCFIGSVICAPLVTACKKPRTLKLLRTRCLRYGAYGVIPGLVLGPVMYTMRMHDKPEDGFIDRCYRLRCNKGQVRVDRLSLGGFIAGGAYGFLTPHNPIEIAVLGMLTGTTLVIIYALSPFSD